MKENEQPPVSDDLTSETEKFWNDPQKIMNLIDLLFLWEDRDKRQICS